MPAHTSLCVPAAHAVGNSLLAQDFWLPRACAQRALEPLSLLAEIEPGDHLRQRGEEAEGWSEGDGEAEKGRG